MHLLSHMLELTAAAIGGLGALVICYGVVVGVVLLVKLEGRRLAGADVQPSQHALRQRVGFYLLLGLEFLLAADILETIGAPDLEHITVLAAIVILRTVISWSLNWELRQEHQATREAAAADEAHGAG